MKFCVIDLKTKTKQNKNYTQRKNYEYKKKGNSNILIFAYLHIINLNWLDDNGYNYYIIVYKYNKSECKYKNKYKSDLN